MKPRRPPSLPLLWTVSILAFIFLLLLLVSLFVVVRIPLPNATLRICYGAIDFFSPPTQPRALSISLVGPMVPAILPAGGTIRGGPFFLCPLWIPAALFSLAARRLYRRFHAVPPGHCRKCRYDLRGNVSGRCPECGAAFSLVEPTSLQDQPSLP